MAKVLFVQSLYFEYLGVKSISAMLKKAGHETDVVIGNTAKLVKGIRKINPDIIGVPCTTFDYENTLSIATKIKESGVRAPIVFGGPHPTFFPEVINNDAVDIICIGEAEYPMVDLADAVDSNGDISAIKNLWVKKDGNIHRNEIRDLTEDLGEFPEPDGDLYRKYKYFQNKAFETFYATRGCVFYCSFCYNTRLMELYKDKGCYHRMRTPDSIIDEIESTVKGNRRLKQIGFVDSALNLDKSWFLSFLKKYRERLRLPYSCNLYFGSIDESLVKELASSGCISVRFGLETGSERLRKEVLKKMISNDKIREVCALLHKYKIEIVAYNMFGLPSETFEEAISTIKLTHELKPHVVENEIFQPYPRLDLTEFALEIGVLTEKDLDSLVRNTNKLYSSILKQQDINEISNLHKFSIFCSYFPWSLPVVTKIVKMRSNFIFNLVWVVTQAFEYKKWTKLGWVEFIKEGIIHFRYIILGKA